MPTDVQIIEPNEVEARHQHETFLSQARELATAIKDDISFQEAGKFLVQLRNARNKWEKEMEDPVRAAYEAHRKLTAKVKEIALPLSQAENILKPAMAKYDWDQREKARIAREKAEREERERQDKAKLDLAEELEKSGKNEEAEQVLNIPTVAAPTKIPDVVKSEGVSFQDYWGFEVTDLLTLVKAVAAGTMPLMAIEANEKFLGQQARSLKDQFKVPGVRLVHDRIPKVKGGF